MKLTEDDHALLDMLDKVNVDCVLIRERYAYLCPYIRFDGAYARLNEAGKAVLGRKA